MEGCQMVCNFFVMSHCKGEVDEVGVLFKRKI
jgi:hypothetical protein